MAFEDAISATSTREAPWYIILSNCKWFCNLQAYQRYLVDKLLNLSIIREVRSSIAIQSLKAGASLPLHHLDAQSA